MTIPAASLVGTVLGYAVSVAAGVFGIAVLSGLVDTGTLPTHFRVTFGVVLLLLAIYRGLTTRMRSTHREDGNA